MIAMLVLVVAIFAIISVNTYTLRAAQGNRSRQVANMIAATELSLAESVLKVNFHAPASAINTVRMTSTRYPEFDFVVEDLGYEDPGKKLRGVRCRVFWGENGVDRSYSLATTFYDY
jgi:hypothetical protein